MQQSQIQKIQVELRELRWKLGKFITKTESFVERWNRCKQSFENKTFCQEYQSFKYDLNELHVTGLKSIKINQLTYIRCYGQIMQKLTKMVDLFDFAQSRRPGNGYGYTAGQIAADTVPILQVAFSIYRKQLQQLLQLNDISFVKEMRAKKMTVGALNILFQQNIQKWMIAKILGNMPLSSQSEQKIRDIGITAMGDIWILQASILN